MSLPVQSSAWLHFKLDSLLCLSGLAFVTSGLCVCSSPFLPLVDLLHASLWVRSILGLLPHPLYPVTGTPPTPVRTHQCLPSPRWEREALGKEKLCGASLGSHSTRCQDGGLEPLGRPVPPHPLTWKQWQWEEGVLG
uniref:Uncharacterized protein n=1 Tax=Rousettus aegyptiacus TaxID=9407 RepID=A0A7J8H0H5_ROUAE|nr:hypothetical protein HJG63_011216 [Rousettus aegyptiacus]